VVELVGLTDPGSPGLKGSTKPEKLVPVVLKGFAPPTNAFEPPKKGFVAEETPVEVMMPPVLTGVRVTVAGLVVGTKPVVNVGV
jgi:hypothetical protein